LSLEHGRRQFEIRQENLGGIPLEKSHWKKFARQNNPLAIKCTYQHCQLSMLVSVILRPFFADARKKWVLGCGPTVARGRVLPRVPPGNKTCSTLRGVPSRRGWKANE
jgi:hypothetical protein